MKFRVLLPGFAAALFVLFPACGKKPEPESPARPEMISAIPPDESDTGTEPKPKPAAPPISLEETAALLGQAADLPGEFETVTVVDAAQIKSRLQRTRIWQDARAMLGADASAPDSGEPTPAETDPGEPADANSPQPADAGVPVNPANEMAEWLTSGKIVIAAGPGTGERTAGLLRLIATFQRAGIKQSLLEFAENSGLREAPEDQEFANPVADMLRDQFEPILAEIESLAPPLLYVALQAPGKEKQLDDMLRGLDAQIEQMLPPFIQRESMDIGGGAFRVLSVKASEVVSLEDFQQGLSGELPPEKIAKLHAALAGKTLSIGIGRRADHLVVFMAPDKNSLSLAANREQSVAANPEFAFLAPYKDKNPFLISMAAREISAGLRSASDSSWYLDVLREVLGEVNGLGDLSDVMALLEKAGGTMKALSAGKDTPFCAVGYHEDGMRLEAIGGADSPALDASQPLAFAGALGGPDTVLTLHARADSTTQIKTLDLLEDLAEVGYELGQRYSASDAAKDSGLAEPFGLFREKMLPHVTTLWRAQRDQITGGLGMESAVVIDLGAKPPKFPGMPEALSEGQIPRIACIYPVLDRSKIASGWQAMEPALKGLLDGLPLPEEQKPRLPDPFTSEKDGLKTYFYGFSGITSDDFLPSASLSDRLFFLSSSKNLTESLAAKLAAHQPTPDAPRGLLLEMHFAPLAKAGTQWLDLLLANAATIFPEGAGKDDFLRSEPDLRKAVNWLGDLDSLKLQRYPEGERWRTSLQIRGKGGE